MESLIEFKNERGIFEALKEKKITSALNYWTIASAQHLSLANLALKLLKLPASSAEIERLFSEWSYVHNSIRTRLTFDKSMKLVTIYYSFKMNDSKKSNDF